MAAEEIVVNSYITTVALHIVAEFTVAPRVKIILEAEAFAISSVAIRQRDVNANLISIAKERTEIHFDI